jgi:hypothetical protein
MDVLHKLKNAYVSERKAHMVATYFTFRHIGLRLGNAEKYWDELTRQEARLLEKGAQVLADTLIQQPKTQAELKTYQLVLKNTNAKLTERGNFLLALVTLMTALSLTKLNDVFPWPDGFWSAGLAFSIVGAAIFFSIFDTVRVRSRAAIHEELINVIDRYLQDAPALAPITAPTPAPIPAVPPSPPAPVAEGVLERFFSKEVYSALFKASILAFGVALVGISQTGPTLYEKELSAYADKFNIEAVTGRTLEDIDCELLTAHKAGCNMAKHKIDASNSALDLLDTIVKGGLRFGMGFLLAAVFIFIASFFVRRAANESRS